MEILELNLPNFWASALINGDTNGLSDDDEIALDDFTNYMVERYGQCWCLTCSDDDGNFMTYHDARDHGVLACDVLVFSFDVTPR